MTIRRAILHIGTEKTGTTTLQQAFLDNREMLAAHGFVLSTAAGGRKSHERLAAYAAEDGARIDVRRRMALETPDALAEFRAQLGAEIAAEAAENEGATMLYTSEHCHSRLVTQGSVDRLAELLRPLFDDIRIVVYLRRQDELAVSRHSTMLKSGGTGEMILDPRWVSHPYFDFWALTQRWEQAFGAEAMVVRRFSATALTGGSIVADFCDALGLPKLPEPARRNESLIPVYQHVLRKMNARIPKLADGRPNPERGALDRLIVAFGSGRGARPPRKAAREFTRAFDASNERVRARYFPEARRLFDPDFTAYPLAGTAEVPDEDRLFDIFADLWRAASIEHQQLAEMLEDRDRTDEEDNAADIEVDIGTAPSPRRPRALSRLLRRGLSLR